MNYKIALITFCLSLNTVNGQADPEIQTKVFIKSFENKTFKLNVEELTTIKNTIYQLITAPNSIITQASILLKRNLNDHMNEIKQEIDALKTNKKPIPFAQWRTLHLLQEQIKHIEGFLEHQKKPTLWQELKSAAHYILNILNFYETQENTQIKKLAQAMTDFVSIEREKILFSYPATIEFLALQKNINLPKPIDFWKEKRHRFRLLQDVKQMNEKVEMQSFIIDIIIQTAIMMGESRYEGWVSEDDKAYYEQLSKLEAQMQSDFNDFETILTDSQATSIENLSNGFSQSITKLNKQRDMSDTLYSNEIKTLNNLYDDSPPQNMYIYDPINLDQAFEISPMYTPKNGITWYNIYPQPNNVLTNAAVKDSTILTNSDWQYNEKSDRFFQNNLLPFQASQKIQDTYKTSIPKAYLPDIGQYAHNNSIFCEYISGAQSYEIDIDATIIGASFPFFIGIMFNKARWISGVVERIEQYRLFGVYGAIDDEGSKKVSLGFAEWDYKPATNEKSKPIINPPLTQIIDKNYQSLAQLDTKNIENLGKNPLTFNFKVTTQSTAATLSASILDTQENKNYLIQNKVISGLNPLVYIYHGIGFMAPGVQAAFKINKPTALTYSDDEKSTFSNLMANKLTS